MFRVGPWQEIPSPYVLVIYGPWRTWIAWLVTEPELLATGEAVALTPPIVSDKALCGNSCAATRITAGRYL
tara:strand:+ start:4455 stop:4667 length:213 start_codon:yes stop_codon:yes gene_type:complete